MNSARAVIPCNVPIANASANRVLHLSRAAISQQRIRRKLASEAAVRELPAEANASRAPVWADHATSMTSVQAIANASEVSATATATLDMSNLVDLALRLLRRRKLLEAEELPTATQVDSLAWSMVW